MRHTFADSLHLIVKSNAKELSDTQAYLLESVVSEWRKSYDRASSDSHRGNVKLEKWLSNNDQGVLDVDDMSERLRNQKPYGMVEMMKVQL